MSLIPDKFWEAAATIHPGIVHFYDAFALLISDDPHHIYGAAAIVRDVVDKRLREAPPGPFREAARKLFYDLDETIFDEVEIDEERRILGLDRGHHSRMITDRWLETVRNVSFRDRAAERIRDTLVSAVERLVELDLHDYTILNVDNIGIKAGKPVIFDISDPHPDRASIREGEDISLMDARP